MKKKPKILTGVNNVAVCSDVGEGLRTVLLDPGSGLAVGGDDEVFPLVCKFGRVGIGVTIVVIVDVHYRYHFRHGVGLCSGAAIPQKSDL